LVKKLCEKNASTCAVAFISSGYSSFEIILDILREFSFINKNFSTSFNILDCIVFESWFRTFFVL
jgi:hypothetical protein